MLINENTIVKEPDDRLRVKCEPVNLPLSEEDRTTLNEMIQYIRDSHDEEKQKSMNLRAAVGIAAPQIGVLKQMIAIGIPSDSEEKPDLEFALVNPKIISNSQQKAYLRNGESCLSVVPDRDGIVPRAARITVSAYDMLQDANIQIRLRNYPAVVFQHEIDHLSGILYFDHINQDDPNLEEGSYPELEDAIIIG